MSTNVSPASFPIGPAGASLIVAVDDAWFEGNSHDNVLPLDRIVGIRQSTSLEDLTTRCKSKASTHSLGDLVYLQCLAEFCLQQGFRLSLCNFEHAESRFDDVNQAGQAALFDVNYANVKDKDYGPKLLVRLLNGRKPRADTFIVTGYGGTYQDLLRRNAHDPMWWTLKKWVNPIVAKGKLRDMQGAFKGFAINFAARAREERFQFWARLGDENWTIVFNGILGNNPNIDVETTYLAVLVAHPGINIHPQWLDMINEAGNADQKKHPKHIRLFLVAELLRRVHDLARPPSPAESVTAAKPSIALEDSEGNAGCGSEDEPSDGSALWNTDQAVPVGAAKPLPDGCHAASYQAPTLTPLADLRKMVEGYRKLLTRTSDEAKRKELETALFQFEAELNVKFASGGLGTTQTANESKNLKGRVLKQYGRAREAFSKSAVKKDSIIAKLAQHFTESLPKGKPRKPMVFKYSPSQPVSWTCIPPD